MSYPTVVRKKIRLCARFGHLPETARWQRVTLRRWRTRYQCVRCGALVRTRRTSPLTISQ